MIANEVSLDQVQVVAVEIISLRNQPIGGSSIQRIYKVGVY